MTKISIIMPTLDEAAFITRQLALLLPWRERGHEIIVADGGSADLTPELARPLADRVITAARGRARQMNAGAELASGDVLLFLHADTRLPDRADELILQGLAAQGRVWGRFDVAIEGNHPMLAVIAGFMNRRSRWTGIATGDQGIFVRREAFLACGGFPDIALMEDIVLSSRLKDWGGPLCLRQKVITSGRRWESRGVFRTIVLMWGLRLAFFFGADPARLAKIYGYSIPE
ncbi:MAG: TIGR04283 family arsenosugar biosynthesis glycosyltransferase [Methylococcaceae bacterium]|nr:TIGR04283 family arsenosugar biosynthesis glycosyltransferase [Methylococcaceae bacterium]